MPNASAMPATRIVVITVMEPGPASDASTTARNDVQEKIRHTLGLRRPNVLRHRFARRELSDRR